MAALVLWGFIALGALRATSLGTDISMVVNKKKIKISEDRDEKQERDS